MTMSTTAPVASWFTMRLLHAPLSATHRAVGLMEA
jgi:hypothetical protein